MRAITAPWAGGGMTPERLLRTAIIPALADLSATGIPDTPAARCILLAIALQESALRRRRQVTASGREDGPAVSWWQFERTGGCRGVLAHPAVAQRTRQLCSAYGVEATEAGLWEAMRYHDIVAAGAARLLIYTLPGALPTCAEDGWRQYLDAWRPGKPHPQAWARCWTAARAIAGEG